MGAPPVQRVAHCARGGITMGRCTRALFVVVALVAGACGTRLDEEAVRRRAVPATQSQPVTPAGDLGGGAAGAPAPAAPTPTTAGAVSAPTEAGAREVEVVQRVSGSAAGARAPASAPAGGRSAGPTAASPTPNAAAAGPASPAGG